MNRRTVSEETRKKISEAQMGEKNHMFGKHLSKDHSNKISESLKGRIVSEETRNKISEGNKGKKMSEETRKKLSNIKGIKHHGFGKHLSDITRKKMSESRMGKKPSEITRKKMSDARKNRGVISEETRKKLSESQKKRMSIKENRDKIRESMMGRVVSEETRDKIRKKHKGRIMSIESRKKMSESNIGKIMPEDRCRKISMTIRGIQNIEDWDGYAIEEPYCNLFTPEFKNRQYESTNYTCILCGNITTNPHCHHVYEQKSSCCHNIDDDNNLYFIIRNKKVYPNILSMPYNKEKELEFGLNKFAVLCSSCHGKVKGHRNGKSFLEYIRDIEHIINTRYNGRSYYTKEEYWGNGYYFKDGRNEKYYDAITNDMYGKYLSCFIGWGIPKKINNI